MYSFHLPQSMFSPVADPTYFFPLEESVIKYTPFWFASAVFQASVSINPDNSSHETHHSFGCHAASDIELPWLPAWH